jgi:hypothetical protein
MDDFYKAKVMAKLILVVGLIMAGAVVHGGVTQRWSDFAVDASRAERMHAHVVPFAESISEKIENEVSTLERSIATSRRYASPTREFAAATSIISGVPGAVATHTPDVCYVASGYTMKGSPVRKSITLPDGTTAAYLVCDFDKATATSAERVRVRWTWTVNGTWDVPNRPRLAYMGERELFKLYVVTALPPDETPGDDRPVVSEFFAATLMTYSEALAR